MKKSVKKLDFVVCVREEFFFPRERFQTFGTNIHPCHFEKFHLKVQSTYYLSARTFLPHILHGKGLYFYLQICFPSMKKVMT